MADPPVVEEEEEEDKMVQSPLSRSATPMDARGPRARANIVMRRQSEVQNEGQPDPDPGPDPGAIGADAVAASKMMLGPSKADLT